MHSSNSIIKNLIKLISFLAASAQSSAIWLLGRIVKLGATPAFIIAALAIILTPKAVSASVIVLYILAAWWAMRSSTPGNRPGQGQNY